MEIVKLVLSALFITIGLVMEIIAVYGVYTQKTVLPRMHAAAIGDTGALGCIILGLIIQSGMNMFSLKLFFVWVFLWITSAVNSHVLAKMIIVGDEDNARANNEFIEDEEVN